MMDVQLIETKISRSDLSAFLNHPFPDFVKIVVDIERGIVAVGGEMHADAEEILLENGSAQGNLWGANIFPNRQKEEMLEYSSLINIRPSQDNRSLLVQDESLREKIKEVVERLIELS